jgi:fused-like protein
VRARACNLAGNLCRHSDRHYRLLLESGVVAALISRCADPDRGARKFACFAIGNAAFHSAQLYEALRPAVRPLVALLRGHYGAAGGAGASSGGGCGGGNGGGNGGGGNGNDPACLEDPKTRANAAGALGNLVRNSSLLCGELVRSGALKALLDTAAAAAVVATPGPAASNGGGRRASNDDGGGGAESGSPAKIALFSLGNMCAHRECREELLALGIVRVLAALQAACAASSSSSASASASGGGVSAAADPALRKYVSRVHAKLAQHGGVPLSSSPASAMMAARRG